jgi:hypothetical protein
MAVQHSEQLKTAVSQPDCFHNARESRSSHAAVIFYYSGAPCSAGFPDLDESVSLLSDLMVGEQFFRISA